MTLPLSRNTPLYQQWYEAQTEANSLEGRAARLEKMEKVVYETIKLAILDSEEKVTVARAEAEARTHKKYVKHVTDMLTAREAANQAKTKADAIKMLHWDQQSEAATERAVARMG